MQLVACSDCHTQYDVSGVDAKTFPCRCGAILENRPPVAADASVQRCGACGALTGPEAAACEYCGAEILREDTSQLSLICPECYARNAEDARFCTACGVTFRPESVRLHGHELPCPVCQRLMPSRQVGGVAVNECGSCGGLWVPDRNFDLLVSRAMEARRNADPVALQALAPRVTGANPASQRVQYRNCPECDTQMLRKNFRKSSGVIIDRCSQHGTWLDANELEQIAGFILSGRQTSPQLANAPARPAPAPGGSFRIHPFPESRGAAEGGFAGSLIDALVALLE